MALPMWIIIVLVIALLASLLLYRRRAVAGVDGVHAETQAGNNLDASERKADFRGVAILPGECACSAVLELGSKRFLLNDVPRLPLQDCSQPECDCYYVNFDDRRDDDRRNPFGSLTNNRLSNHDDDERRNRNRRAGDSRSE